jgi:hypothetical protein
MKKTALILIFAFIGMISCKKDDDQNNGNNPEPPSETTKYSIGDYYKVGGVEGIVFEISENGKHGKIISMDEITAEWALTSSWTVLTNANDEHDGLINTNIIHKDFDVTEYPAFKWCIDKNSNNTIKWYFPAKNELLAIYSVYEILQDALNKHGGNLLNNSIYWSSTEHPEHSFTSWFVNFSTGEAAFNTVKFDNRWFVRAIRTF